MAAAGARADRRHRTRALLRERCGCLNERRHDWAPEGHHEDGAFLKPWLQRVAISGKSVGPQTTETTRKPLRPASASSAAASGKRVSSWSTIRACCSCTVVASGWAKIVRTIVATKLCALFATRVSRLRMKWVRQRRQAAPGSVAEIASTRPGCASELTSLTPARPRATRPRTNANPSGAVLGGDDVEPERLAEAVAVDANRVHDADVDRAAALAALDLKRIQGHLRVGCAVERAAAEVLDDHVQALRQPRDLALRHPLDPELLHELLDSARRDAREVGVRDHRHERLLGAPARLQQPVREIRALAQLRHRQLDRADPG